MEAMRLRGERFHSSRFCLKAQAFICFSAKAMPMITGGYHRNTVGNDPITDCGSEAVTFSRGRRSQISSVAGANHSQTAGIDPRAGIQSSVQGNGQDRCSHRLPSVRPAWKNLCHSPCCRAGWQTAQHSRFGQAAAYQKWYTLPNARWRTIMKKYNRQGKSFPSVSSRRAQP